MSTYVVLANFTDQGISNVGGTLERANRTAEIAEKHGGRIERIYWTVGAHDVVLIAEAPDDEALTAMLLEVGSAGNLRTTTLRAFDREEMERIVGRLG